MVAFLLNQLNVGAFKINTMEKLDTSGIGKLSQSNNKSDFSKELRSAVDEKRKYENSDTSSLKKFEKKLSKVNHESKEKTNALNQEKISEKKSEEVSPTRKLETKKTEDPSRVDLKEETQTSKGDDENPIVESTKKEDAATNKTDEVKDAVKTEESVTSTPTEETDLNLAQMNAELSKIAEQLVSLMQKLQETGNAKLAPTNEELTKATELLDKIKTGKIEPADAFGELGKLMDNIKTLGVTKGQESAGNSEFGKLMELTGDKLKVLKNELADAKTQMNKLSAKGDNLEKLTANLNDALLKKTDTVNQTAQTLQASPTSNTEGEKTESVTKSATATVTEGAEELGALQGKQTILAKDEKLVKTETEAAADSKVTTKAEALKAETKANNENANNESFTNGNNAKATEGTLKTEKSSDNVSFQTIAQNTVKETEKPAETGRLNRTPIIDKAEVLSQIVKKADLLVGKTQSEMIMKLEPENLGKVTLKIAMERGTMTATFQAENQQIKSLIESNTDSLRDMLQEKGINISAINVSVNQQSGDNQSWKNQNQGQFNENTFGKREAIGNRGNSMIGTYGIVGMTDAMSTKTNPYTKHDGEFDYRG